MQNIIIDSFTFLNLIIFLIILIKLIISIKKLKYFSNKILLVIFIIISYSCLRYLLIQFIEIIYDIKLPINVYANPTIICAFPILAYLYIQTLLSKQIMFEKKDIYHLVTFILIFIIYEFPYKTNLYSNNTLSEEHIFWSNYLRPNNPPIWILGIRIFVSVAYCLLTYRLLHKHFKVKSQSELIKKIKKWLYMFTNLKLFLAIMLTTAGILVITSVKQRGFSSDFSEPIRALILLFIVIFIYKKKDIVFNVPVYLNQNDYNNLKIKEEINLNEIFKNISHKILIQELYLNKSFKLIWLSDKLDIKQKHITLAISENGFENFSSYANHFKINKSKQLIKVGYLDDFSIDALALAAGFNATNSFYRIFKSSTGLTPRRYAYMHNKS